MLHLGCGPSQWRYSFLETQRGLMMQNPTHQQHVGNVINHSVDGKKETHPNKAGCTQGNMSIYTMCL